MTSAPPVSTEHPKGTTGNIFDLTGRVSIITGSGQGIGREYARQFAAAGARVVVVDINRDACARVATEISQGGGSAIAQAVDITDDAAVAVAVQEVIEQFGRVDVLINNAAVFSGLTLRPFDELPLAEWDRVLKVNITGSYLYSKHVVPHMRDAGWGRIINVSSAGVSQGLTNCLHYTTSKSAIVGMTYSMARELGPAGITVNAIAPGGTQTEIPRATQTDEGRSLMLSRQCIKRLEVPEDLIGLAMFLASPAAGFLTGQVIACDGGSVHR